MFVRKAALDLPSPPVAIAQQFQLTPAELRVLFSIVEIGGVSEMYSGFRRRRSEHTCTACLRKPAPAAKPIWSSWWPAIVQRLSPGT
jgi:hypothetical protein